MKHRYRRAYCLLEKSDLNIDKIPPCAMQVGSTSNVDYVYNAPPIKCNRYCYLDIVGKKQKWKWIDINLKVILI